MAGVAVLTHSPLTTPRGATHSEKVRPREAHTRKGWNKGWTDGWRDGGEHTWIHGWMDGWMKVS